MSHTLPLNDCLLHPELNRLGSQSLVQHLFAPLRAELSPYVLCFETAVKAMMIHGLHKDGNHHIEKNHFHWLHSIGRLHYGDNKDDHMEFAKELRELAFNALTALNCHSGGLSLMLHIEGSVWPHFVSAPENIKVHICVLPALLVEFPHTPYKDTNHYLFWGHPESRFNELVSSATSSPDGEQAGTSSTISERKVPPTSHPGRITSRDRDAGLIVELRKREWASFDSAIANLQRQVAELTVAKTALKVQNSDLVRQVNIFSVTVRVLGDRVKLLHGTYNREGEYKRESDDREDLNQLGHFTPISAGQAAPHFISSSPATPVDAASRFNDVTTQSKHCEQRLTIFGPVTFELLHVHAIPDHFHRNLFAIKEDFLPDRWLEEVQSQLSVGGDVAKDIVRTMTEDSTVV
ncbi:hypothetical protein EVJ58_g266 [Rhodofomes roseus]|uniref:Uncharacterized protein n=1 Tax=Rhodofomes roseus TaxID=34475 RepID=A0A4Y9Z6E6_9APHY|nr:hypothetical protein EVJ58_g266 [Rhodofomes roseus]